MNKVPENDFTRLASLDILRGFDLFLLVFFQPVFVALARQLNLPFLDEVLYQFDHEVWEGFRFWDLVMPLFLFMTGASMPFSLSKYKTASVDYWPVYRRILKRVILLFIFGMIVQGNLLGFDSKHIYFYSNTLQSIAVGYFIAAVIQLHFSFGWQIIITLLLLLAYWIPMTFLGDFTPAGNFAEQVDRWVLGRFRDGVFWNEDGKLKSVDGVIQLYIAYSNKYSIFPIKPKARTWGNDGSGYTMEKNEEIDPLKEWILDDDKRFELNLINCESNRAKTPQRGLSAKKYNVKLWIKYIYCRMFKRGTKSWV
mgnify:CR=1 FL=1